MNSIFQCSKPSVKWLSLLCSVIRASVPKLNLDDVFEQKNGIARAVEDELEKVEHLAVSRRRRKHYPTISQRIKMINVFVFVCE